MTSFVARAESICARATEDQAALPFPGTLPEIVTYTKDTIAITTTMTRRLAALEPPPEHRRAIRWMLQQLDAATSDLARLAEAAGRQDSAAVLAAGAEAEARLQQADRIARSYGLLACSTQAG